jgi:hypothetical protein
MASTSKKWFIGCGIGCGFMLLVLGGMGISVFMLAKKGMEKADNIGESYTLVEETYGSPGEFIPALDGSISPRRVEAFLETRRTMTPAREKLSRILFVLQGEMDGFEKSGASKMELLKAGIGLVPALFEFIESSNTAMLDEGMGPGEYQYIYSLAYYGLLGKDSGDGPAFTITGDDEDSNENGGFQWSVGSGSSSDDGVSRDDRAREVRDHLNVVLGQVLHNQMSALRNSGAAGDDPVLVALAVEIAAMDGEKYRLIWEEEIPAQIRASLEPYLAELDELYDPIMNVIEIVGISDD